MEPRFRCPTCRAKMKADRELGGKEVQCPRCSTSVLVPKVSYSEGDMIAGFRLEAWIGSGSMGEVYKARQLSMDREVAIKLLRPDMLEDSEHIERFNSEVRMLAKLDHPNIVTAFEAGQYEEHYFLAMSFVSGYNLDECLLDRETLPEKEIVKVAIKVGKALGYAWNRLQILHRDIKPSNIMIDNDGEVKLTDVGIAMRVGEELDATQSGYVLGTPYYMSPEQASGSRDLDFRADMFSLGSTLFHLVTGEAPFDGQTPMDIMLKVIHEDARDPCQVNPELSRETGQLIRRMMARQRDERFPSWDAMIEAAQRIVRGEPEKVSRRSAASATKPRRKKVFAAIPPPTPTPTLDAVPPRSTIGWLVPLLAAVVGLLLIGIVVFQVMKTQNRPHLPLPDNGAPPPVPQAAAPQAGNESTTSPEQGDPAPTPAELRRYETMLLAARDWLERNPSDYEGSIKRFEAVISEAAGTRFAQLASRDLERLKADYTQLLEFTRRELQNEAADLARAGKLQETVDLLVNYEGILAAETREWRLRTAVPYRERLQVEDRQQRERRVAARRELRELADLLATELMAGRIAAAQQIAADGLARESLQPLQESLKEMHETIADMRRWQEWLVDSFREDIGKDIQVRLKNGQEAIALREVELTRIRGMKTVEQGRLGVTIQLSDLAFSEIYSRLSNSHNMGVQLALALMSVRAGEAEKAAGVFRGMDAPWSRSLMQALHAQVPSVVESLAVGELRKVLEQLGMFPTASMLELYATLAGEPLSPEVQQEPSRLVNELRATYGFTRIVRDYAPALDLITRDEPLTASWPYDRTSLVFMWGPGANLLQDPLTGKWRQVELELRDGARIDEQNRLIFPGGAAVARAPAFDDALLAACQASNEISIEFVVEPTVLDQFGPARIIGYSSGLYQQQLMIGQEQASLNLRLKVGNSSSSSGTSNTFKAQVPIHLVVTYHQQSGLMTFYTNGRQGFRNMRGQEGFSEWEKMSLLFGNETTLNRGWQGTLSHIAIYSRTLSQAEVTERYRLYRAGK